MRTLAIAAILVACNTTETTETEAAVEETVETENTETMFTTPVDVVDEEAKRLQSLENTNFSGDQQNFTTEDNSFEEAE